MAKKKTSSKSDKSGNSETLNFEQSLSEVEQIVARLEGGQLGLTESLQQYEQGIRQLKLCHELLDAAEQRVNVLAGFDAEGNPVLEPLQGASKSRKPKLAGQSSDADSADLEDDRPGLF